MDRITVVIAEDDASTRAIYAKILGNDAFHLIMAGDGREALTLYQTMKPDIMVLDIMLPVMTGYSVLKEIRQQAGDRRTPVFMASSISRKESVLDCIALGIQGYLVKPLVPADVLQRILKCCDELCPAKADAARQALAGSAP
jgi:CheY-like chemotaxis protein